MTQEDLEIKYQELCKTPSDINEHLPILREYADKCEHITEMGVRGCVSLHAFLVSKAKKVVAIDISATGVPDVDKLTFIVGDDLKIEIEPTDLLLIDTMHNYVQLKQELALHAGKVSKYIFFHDTGYFGINGDDGGKGLLPAINEFLETHKEWKIVYQTDKNNGLTIIAK